MRGTLLETVIGFAIAMVMAILAFGQIDKHLPDQPRQVQCSIVKEQIVCQDLRAKK